MLRHRIVGLKTNPDGVLSTRPSGFLSFASVLGLGLLACAPSEGTEQGLVDAQDALADSAGLDSSEPMTSSLLLMDRLDDARIKSPLVGLAPAESLEELSDSKIEILLDEGFDDFQWQPHTPIIAKSVTSRAHNDSIVLVPNWGEEGA